MNPKILFVLLILGLVSGCVSEKEAVEKYGCPDGRLVDEPGECVQVEPTTVSTSIPETSTTTRVGLTMPETEGSHFGFMHPQEAYPEAMAIGVRWERPHEGPFIWNDIQPKKGEYDWARPDKYVEISQSHDFNIVGTIWPFADWDQLECHNYRNCRGYGFDKPRELPKLRCKPCDMKAYSDFVKALVERYDGDGIDDMPGLKYPIRYWEASNEPEMQKSELAFFIGTSDEYFEILKATYNAVKEANPKAKVLHAGFAGMGKDSLGFWEPIFAKSGDYFDIANVHSIGQDNEDFFVDDMKKLLKKHNLVKPVWVTEAEYNRWEGGNAKEGFAKQLVKSYSNAFGNGAEKIFYVGLTTPTPGHPDAALFGRSRSKNPMYHSYETLVKKIDYFESVEKLTEGQYRFLVKEKPVWVLWGAGPLPSEIMGDIRVTDISGKERLLFPDQVTLSDSPLFIEMFG